MARQGWGRHTTVATGSNDATKQVSVNAWNADLDNDGVLGFTPETIASASTVTPTNSLVKLSGSTSIDTIAITNTSEGDLLWVYTSGSVTLNNTSSPSSDGDIKLSGNANKDLSTTVPTTLIRVSTYWYEYAGGDVTSSSTTTFTNKSIDLTDNTLTGTSLELKTAISDETGSGSLVFATSPTLVTPALGQPASGNLADCTFPTLNQSTTGSSASCTGNSATATALETARTIGGTSFDGTGNIAITTNANLTGDVTSSGNATTIATDAVDIAMLSATGTAGATTFLRGDNTWAAAGSQISLLETVTLGSPNANVAKASMSYSTDDYAYFIIVFSGKAVTSEAAALEFRINNLSANYGYTVTQNYNGSITGSAAGITTEIPLMSATVHASNSQPMNVIVTIQSSTVGNRYYNIVSDAWVASNTVYTEHVIGGQAGTASTTFSKFDFLLSTGNNFDTDSEAVLYGVLR